MMHLFRRFRAPIVAVAVLICLSVLLFLTVGDGVKLLVIQEDGVSLRKRDGITINFSLPWKSALSTKHDEDKALSPVLGGLLGDVTSVASAILDDGLAVASSVEAQGKAVVNATQVSVVFDGEAAIVASVLSEVNSIINDATGVLGGVVSNATGIVGSIIGGVAGTSDTNHGTSMSNDSASSSKPQGFSPQSHAPTSMPPNITSAAFLPGNSLSSAVPAGVACPSITMTTITPCCPDVSTVTSTIKETWYSTYFESTQTLYSFMSIFTITCTETVSVCPPSNPYLFSENNTILSSSNPISCANGVLAKSREVCPLVSIPLGPANMSSPCAMMATSLSSGGNPTSSAVSLFSSTGTNAISSSVICPNGQPARGNEDCSNTNPFVLSTMASFTASPPSLASAPLVTAAASLIASITCADGALVILTQDCLDGLSESKTSSLLAFRTSPALIIGPVTATTDHAASPGNNMLSSMGENVVLALSNVQGLTGDLLSTVLSDVTSVINAVNSLTGVVLPTGGVLSIVGTGGAAAGNIVPAVTGAALTISETGEAAAGDSASTLIGGLNALESNGIASAGNSAAGNRIPVAGNIISRLETTVNGVPMFLSVAATVLTEKPTAVPVVNTLVNVVPTMPPAADDGAGLLSGLNSGEILKSRRRVTKREHRIPRDVAYYCEKNPLDEICLFYMEGGGL